MQHPYIEPVTLCFGGVGEGFPQVVTVSNQQHSPALTTGCGLGRLSPVQAQSPEPWAPSIFPIAQRSDYGKSKFSLVCSRDMGKLGTVCEGIVKSMDVGWEQRWNVLEICLSGREQRVQKWMLFDSVFILQHMISPDGQHSCHQSNHNVVFLPWVPLPNPMLSLYTHPPRTISETL